MTEKHVARMIDLCEIDEIPDNSARGFVLDINGLPQYIFIIRKSGRVFAYENRCPHTGTSLDWQPDQFLDAEENLIQCSTHGALFQIEDGRCIYGPCVNQSLSPVKAEINGSRVWITTV